MLTLLCLTLMAIPATAQQIVYDNGPVNGEVDAWTINFGFEVSDTFHMRIGTLNSIAFYAWLIPGDTISNVEVQIGPTAFSNNYGDEFVNLTQSNCFANNFGYNVCVESGNLGMPLNLGAGNYWMTLGNAVVPSGDPVYWDENSGVGCQSQGCPSMGEQSTLGTIPSEAFTISGTQESTTLTSTSTTGSTPEPASILLFASGILGLANMVRRRLF
jgi:hypothetical protein